MTIKFIIKILAISVCLLFACSKQDNSIISIGPFEVVENNEYKILEKSDNTVLLTDKQSKVMVYFGIANKDEIISTWNNYKKKDNKHSIKKYKLGNNYFEGIRSNLGDDNWVWIYIPTNNRAFVRIDCESKYYTEHTNQSVLNLLSTVTLREQ